MQAKITFIEGKHIDLIQVLIFQKEPYQVIVHKTLTYSEQDLNTLRDLIETHDVQDITYNGCHSFMDSHVSKSWLESRVLDLAEKI